MIFLIEYSLWKPGMREAGMNRARSWAKMWVQLWLNLSLGGICSMNGPTLKLEGHPLDPHLNQSLAAGNHLGGGGHHPGISSGGDTVAPATGKVL